MASRERGQLEEVAAAEPGSTIAATRWRTGAPTASERDSEGRGINGSATDYRTLVPAIWRPSSVTSNASAMAL
jgi:hypothetical protein